METDSFLVKPGRKMFLVVFVGRRMVMGICFGNVPFPPSNTFVSCLSLLSSWHWIVVSGLGVYFGMVGYLVFVVCLVDKHSRQVIGPHHHHHHLLGMFGTEFFLARPRRKMFLVAFVVREGDGHLFWECTFPPLSSLQHVRELPEFAFLMSLERSNWPRCLLWHGWLLGLSGVSDKDAWATSFGDLASFHLERCLGAYPVDFDGSWTPPEYLGC